MGQNRTINWSHWNVYFRLRQLLVSTNVNGANVGLGFRRHLGLLGTAPTVPNAQLLTSTDRGDLLTARAARHAEYAFLVALNNNLNIFLKK